MRPKKVIVLAGSDEDRLSRRAFLLRIWGYNVITATAAQEALAILKVRARGITGEVDLLCVDLPLPGCTAKILDEARRMHPQLRILVTGDHAGWYDVAGMDVFLPLGYSAAELLERIRILVARKRGPRKKPVVSAQVSVVGKSERAA